MTRPTLLFLLILAIPSPATGQEGPLHPRVGVAIDDTEREYFNLFRLWPAGTVVTEPASGDSVRFVLDSGTTWHTTVSHTAFNELATYVDRYEDARFLQDSLDWTRVAPIGRFGNRFRPKAAVRYVFMDGSSLRGTLLRARDNDLISLIGTPMYHWNADDTRRLVVSGSGLARLERSRAGWVIPNRLLFGLGAVAGGTMLAAPDFLAAPTPGDVIGLAGFAVASYGAISWALSRKVISISGDKERLSARQQELAKYAAFQPGAMPPELADNGLPPAGSFDIDRPKKRAAQWTRGRYVSAGMSFLFAGSGSESVIGTGFGLQPAERRQAPFLRIDVSQDHSRSIGYGLETILALPSTAEENQIDYSGQLVTLHGDYYLMRPDMLAFSRRWSLSAGIGVTAGRFQSRAPVSFSRQITGLDPTLVGVDTIGQSSFVVGGQLRLSAGWLMDDRTMLELQVSAWVPSISLDTEERTYISSTLYTLDAIDMPLGASFVVKKRLHSP